MMLLSAAEPHRPPLITRAPGFPDLLALHRIDPQRYPFLLESVAHGTPQARYDLLFAFPGESLALLRPGELRRNDVPVGSESFLATLDAWWQSERVPAPASGLPFQGGWFLYLGYELAAEVEPILSLPARDPFLPTAFATRIPAAVIRDHAMARAWIVAEPGGERMVEAIRRDLEAIADRPARGNCRTTQLAEDPAQRYLDHVRRIQHYVTEGDVFQVNLSRQWSAAIGGDCDHASLYERLRIHNPAPFAGLLTYKDTAVVSSSPERLVRVRDGIVETRPIAGTRPRGHGLARDQAFSEELLAHPKERAEHIMLIDLERNDLGRVCRTGSVRVDELMVLESYSHVHHIVSNVRGKLRAGITPGEVIRAVFPGGTITGCPKVRCMEIIAELEGCARGAYTGSMGYLNHNGDMDLNILIRTMVRRGDTLALRAGAGIVADSLPERELEETRAKAKGLLLALKG